MEHNQCRWYLWALGVGYISLIMIFTLSLHKLCYFNISLTSGSAVDLDLQAIWPDRSMYPRRLSLLPPRIYSRVFHSQSRRLWALDTVEGWLSIKIIEANPIHFMYELLNVRVRFLLVIYIKNDMKMLIFSRLVMDEMPGMLTGIFFIGAGFHEEEID